MNETDILFDLCSKINKKYEKQIKKLAKDMTIELNESLLSHNIPLREYRDENDEKKGILTDSSQKLLAQSKVINFVLLEFEFNFLF